MTGFAPRAAWRAAAHRDAVTSGAALQHVSKVLRRCSAVFCLLSAVACGGRYAGPTTGPHPAGATHYLEVPYPPPPAKVEVVPPRPSDSGAVWVDGEWGWQGKRWVWQPGGWVVPPSQGYFAPWLVYRLDNGRLLFAPGAWHAASGEKLPNPVVLDAARNGLNEDDSPKANEPRAPSGAR